MYESLPQIENILIPHARIVTSNRKYLIFHSGANSIDNTPGITFQEEVFTSVRRPEMSVPLSK